MTHSFHTRRSADRRGGSLRSVLHAVGWPARYVDTGRAWVSDRAVSARWSRELRASSGSPFRFLVLPTRGRCGRWCSVRFGCAPPPSRRIADGSRSEEHTSELQSLMRISYAVFCLTKTTCITRTVPTISLTEIQSILNTVLIVRR